MKFEFNEKKMVKEFLDLSHRCESLPEVVNNLKPEWKLRNRYTNIQPCKLNFY